MDRATILVVLFLLQGSCHGSFERYVTPPNGLYDRPGDDPGPPGYPCDKTVTSTIPVTITAELPGSLITDTRVIPPETSFLNLPPVTTTFVVTEYEAKPPVTDISTLPPQTTWVTLPRKTVISTIPVYITEYLEPLTEITTLEKTITETKNFLTSTVVKKSIVTLPPVISVTVLEGSTHVIELFPKEITSTIPIISTKTIPHCCTSTETSKKNVWTTLPPSTSHYTPTITRPAITITHTKITTTHVTIEPKTITKTYTKTNILEKDCNTYDIAPPSNPWTITPTYTPAYTAPNIVDTIDLANNPVSYATSVRSSTSTTTREFINQPPTYG